MIKNNMHEITPDMIGDKNHEATIEKTKLHLTLALQNKK